MKIVLDLQSLQTGSRLRGIGSHTLSMSKALIESAVHKHQFIILLNNALPHTDTIKLDFSKLIGAENIIIFHPVTPNHENNQSNRWRIRASEYIRDLFIKNINPDIVHSFSLFEGFEDEYTGVVYNPPKKYLLSATHHDLIPLFVNLSSSTPDPIFQSCYIRKIRALINSDIIFPVSFYAKNEIVSTLGLNSEKIVVASNAADCFWRPLDMTSVEFDILMKKYHIPENFILCSPGGYDPSKNIPNLLIAYAQLTNELKDPFHLVLTATISVSTKKEFMTLANNLGISNHVHFTGYVPKDDLLIFYNKCKLFICPSLIEGFGLPALEAMSCGAATIASNRTSLPEVINNPEALFDPLDTDMISSKISMVLTNSILREQLIEKGLQQSKAFSWEKSAHIMISKWEEICNG